MLLLSLPIKGEILEGALGFSSIGPDLPHIFGGGCEIRFGGTDIIDEIVFCGVGNRSTRGQRNGRFEWNGGDRMLFVALSRILELLLVVGDMAFFSIRLATGLDALVSAVGSAYCQDALV